MLEVFRRHICWIKYFHASIIIKYYSIPKIIWTFIHRNFTVTTGVREPAERVLPHRYSLRRNRPYIDRIIKVRRVIYCFRRKTDFVSFEPISYHLWNNILDYKVFRLWNIYTHVCITSKWKYSTETSLLMPPLSGIISFGTSTHKQSDYTQET